MLNFTRVSKSSLSKSIANYFVCYEENGINYVVESWVKLENAEYTVKILNEHEESQDRNPCYFITDKEGYKILT